MGILITLLIAALIFWLIWYLIDMLPVKPEPIRVVLRIVLILIAILWLLKLLGVSIPGI